MTICSEPTCKSKQNIWTISNENNPPSFYQPFDICDKHLNDNRFEEMHKALALGRYNKQDGNSVHFDGWTLNKNISTWKRNHSYECSQCDRTDKIWANVKCQNDWGHSFFNYYHTTYLCDGHLPREKFGETPATGGRNGGPVIIYPIEVTWNKKNGSSKKSDQSDSQKVDRSSREKMKWIKHENRWIKQENTIEQFSIKIKE